MDKLTREKYRAPNKPPLVASTAGILFSPVLVGNLSGNLSLALSGTLLQNTWWNNEFGVLERKPSAVPRARTLADLPQSFPRFLVSVSLRPLLVACFAEVALGCRSCNNTTLLSAIMSCRTISTKPCVLFSYVRISVVKVPILCFWLFHHASPCRSS